MKRKTKNGLKIKERRVLAGLTQGELADKLGVTQMTISNWEHSKTSPKEAQKKNLEEILGSSTHEEEAPRTSAIAAWVNKARNAKMLSVPELATLAGLTSPAIYRIESGVTRNLRPKTREKLEIALGAIPQEMVKEAEEEASVKGLGSLEDFDPHNDDERPAEPGIYVLYDISDRPIYVGEGMNVRRRIKDHEDKFWFKRPIVQTASWIKVEQAELRIQIEEILIKFLKSNAVINKQHVAR